MKVEVLIPVGGPDCEHRAKALDWMIHHYAVQHPWPVMLGRCPDDQPWSKGAAVDAAYRESDADLFLLADADSFVAPGFIAETINAARHEGWAQPHGMVYRLCEAWTAKVYAGFDPYTMTMPQHLARGAYRGVRGGGIVAITREAYETVHGIDPRFEGWGGEDVSFAYALSTLVGPGARLGGDLFHLWHPHPAPDLRGSPDAEALVDRYLKARHKLDEMRALIAERMVTA